MPKHGRHVSGSHNLYANHLPVAMAPSSMAPSSMAPSSMYSQQRMPMPSNFYALPPSSTAPSIQLPPQQQPPPPSYDPYPTGGALAADIPPAQHRASSGAWTPQDDQQLLAARMQGLNWGQIKKQHFPSKSANACRKRHERLMERKSADDWDNRKLQQLAKEYMGMRKEIWSGLAARTGEKWNVVEQKCMSNGLKNLQSASRAASRRDRLEAGAPLSGYDDDSGISGIGLTPVDELDASYSSPDASPSGTNSASSSTASAAAAYHHHLQPHAHAHLQPLAGGQGSYAVSAYPGGYGPHHGYSSSVSSNASVGHGYGPHATGNSQGGSPYMHGQRMSSVDMGIDAIINRPGGHGI